MKVRQYTALLTPPPGFTFNGGTLDLGEDGRFSYMPPFGFAGVDTFWYYDEEDTGQLSNVARVDLHVSLLEPQPFVPTAALDPGAAWPKFHADETNAGMPPDPGTATRSALPGTFVPQWTYSTNGSPIQGSPVVGLAQGEPALFITAANGLHAMNAVSGSPLWATSITAGGTMAGQAVYPAPALVSGASGASIVIAGTGASGQLVALDGNTGDYYVPGGSTFTARESFTLPGGGVISTVLGPVASSPTIDPAHETIIFGSDGAQNLGPSHGKLYALRADGTLAWLTLLAGEVHGSPAVAAPGATIDPDGAVYIGTLPNIWSGLPGVLGSTEGRFYKLNAASGAVEAEVFRVGDVVSSPVFLPDPADPGEPSGPGARVFVTDTSGRIDAFNPAVLPPGPGEETPTLVRMWAAPYLGMVEPTTPALSTDGLTLYLGDNMGLRALSTATGAQLFYFQPQVPGSVVGAPAVLPDEHGGADHVILGARGATGQVFDLNGATGQPWIDPWQGANSFVTAPALGFNDMFEGTHQTPVFIATDNGRITVLT